MKHTQNTVETQISLKEITRKFKTGNETVIALENVSIDICKGDELVICGPSGAGKSTLLNILGFIDSKFQGDYCIFGKNLRNISNKEKAAIRNKVFGYVFQEYALIENETSYENIRIPLYYSKTPYRDHKRKILSILDQVGLSKKANVKVSNLSGGQRQRVSLARCLINEPLILLADEPTSALDIDTANWVKNMLFDYKDAKEERSLILVTHQKDSFYREGQRVMHLDNGKLRSFLSP